MLIKYTGTNLHFVTQNNKHRERSWRQLMEPTVRYRPGICRKILVFEV